MQNINQAQKTSANGVSDPEGIDQGNSQPVRNILRRLARTGPAPLRNVLLVAKAAHHYARKKGGWQQAPLLAVKRCWQLLRKQGLSGLKRQFQLYLYRISRSQSYRIPFHTHLDEHQAELIFGLCGQQPLISLVIPVYRVEPRWLNLCLQSVLNQQYPHWEAVIVDDGSNQPELRALLTEWTQRDSRFRLITLTENKNISAATNAGIAQVRGDWVGFLDHDDELTPDALTWIVANCNLHPEAKWFYTDEAIIDPQGNCLNLHLKPDFSPEFLLSAMFTCHLSVYAADLVRELNGFRVGFEGAQDHDFALRAAEKIDRSQVVHIPRVLYHWRAIESSTAADVSAKPQAVAVGLRAVREALARRGIPGTVASSPHCATMYEISLIPQSCPHVSILIPTKNGFADLKNCVDSIIKHTNYPCYEIVVIDNQSDDPKLLRYLQDAEARKLLRTLRYDAPFNHSEMNNVAVATCSSDYLVLMNNDVEILSGNWLETMMATLQLEDSIAGVGAKLLYPDRTIQHAGMLLGIGGLAGHAHRFVADDDPGYLCRASLLNEFSGATAALLLLKKTAFEEVGGFDAESFPTSFNDADLWIRLQQAGYRCLYNPQVKAIHFESKTRRTPRALESEYENRLKLRWASQLANDPFYNPNLGLDNEIFMDHRSNPIDLETLLKELFESGKQSELNAAPAQRETFSGYQASLTESQPLAQSHSES